MSEAVNYDSLKNRLNAIKKEKEGNLFNFRNIKRIKKVDEYNSKDFSKLSSKEKSFKTLTRELSNFNSNLNKGDFVSANYDVCEIRRLLKDKSEEISKEDKLKYLNSLNKRIERGINYLEKNPYVHKNLEVMENILGYSKAIEEEINSKLASGLEKTITSTGILALVGSLFFLIPNFTGNAVSDSSIIQSTLIGSGFFILGICLLFLRKKV
jgi:hypothetical protein